MTVYFTASIVGKKQYRANYEAIVENLEARGILVLADHILETTEEQIRLESRKERLDFHKQLTGWIDQADFLVADTSFPSISVGYEISLALNRRKPVLILYSEGDPPSLLAQHSDEKLICEHYTKHTLPQIIDEFLLYIKGASDSRFTFFVTPAIASYLDAVAKKKNTPKSVYLRMLIEEHMGKHPI